MSERRRAMMANQKKYAIVEYLQNNYGQLAFTLHGVGPKTILSTDFMVIEVKSNLDNQFIFSSATKWTDSFIVGMYSKGEFTFEGCSLYKYITLNEKHHLHLELNSLNYDNSSILTFERTDQSRSEIRVFSENTITRQYPIYLYEDNALIEAVMPAVRLSDGKTGLYDEVSKTFTSTTGTGNTDYGAVIKYV